jgi:SSS family solute:Na+ symporter
MFMGLCAAAFLPAFAVGIYAKNPSTKAAVASMITGAFVWLVLTVFVHAAEAKPLGICQALLGRATLLGAPWTFIDPLVIALPLSTVVMVALQYSFSKGREAGISTV